MSRIYYATPDTRGYTMTDAKNIAYVAVYSDGLRHPIVYGFGPTPQAARDDTMDWVDGYTGDGLRIVRCTPRLARQLAAGGSPECEIVTISGLTVADVRSEFV